MRLKLNLDVWVCSCGEAVVMGRYCGKCGATYADQLQEEYEAKSTTPKPKKNKLRKPAEERKFTKSYLFRKEK